MSVAIGCSPSARSIARQPASPVEPLHGDEQLVLRHETSGASALSHVESIFA